MSAETGETKEDRYLRQTNEQYAALGRYVQEFEQVLHAIRFLITSIFQKNGLQNGDLIDAIINHRFITAQVLIDSISSIMLHSYSTESDEFAVVAELSKRFHKEIEIRNEYLHGTWFISWANETQQDFSEMSGFKRTSSPRKGLQLNELPKPVSELQARISTLEEIKDAFWRLLGCVTGGFPVRENFVKFEGRYVSPDTARKRGWEILEQ